MDSRMLVKSKWCISAKDDNITLDSFNKIEVNVELFVMRDMSYSRASGLSPSNSLVSLSQNNIQSNDSVRIPIYDEVCVSAGRGFINDEHISWHIGLDKSFLRSYFGLTFFLDLSIITAREDSMLPAVPENCQIIVQKGTPREGQICVTRIDDEFYVKRLQKHPKYKLISDNKSYDDIELEGREYEIPGIVVGLFQKIHNSHKKPLNSHLKHLKHYLKV